MPRESPADKAVRLDRIIKAWEAFAPTRAFSKMTLAEFKAAVRPSLQARAAIEDLQVRIRHEIERRNVADRKSFRLVKYIVAGVMGDRDHGEDSALYAALGYIPRSARRKRRRRAK